MIGQRLSSASPIDAKEASLFDLRQRNKSAADAIMAKTARERVEVKPALLRWARDRAGMQPDDLARRFPQLSRWESGEARPTRRQLERFAKATPPPVDHLLLAKPPVERVPIPDFRAVGNGRIGRPSPNLLDTLSLCRQRQAWYRDF